MLRGTQAHGVQQALLLFLLKRGDSIVTPQQVQNPQKSRESNSPVQLALSPRIVLAQWPGPSAVSWMAVDINCHGAQRQWREMIVFLSFRRAAIVGALSELIYILSGTLYTVL